MRNFLQRLSASTVQPRENIHPFVGSIFSAAKQESAANAVSNYEGFSVAGSSQPATLDSEASLPASSAARKLDSPTSRDSAGVRPVLVPFAEQDTFRPLLSKEDLAAFTVSGHVGFGTREQPRAVPQQGNASSERDAPERLVFEGLSSQKMRSELARSLWQVGDENERSRSGNQERRVTAAHALRPLAPPREPDEIQIHIGRIEVTAIPQQAARPAPPPPRRAISLDDYLRRRDGRAG